MYAIRTIAANRTPAPPSAAHRSRLRRCARRLGPAVRRRRGLARAPLSRHELADSPFGSVPRCVPRASGHDARCSALASGKSRTERGDYGRSRVCPSDTQEVANFIIKISLARLKSQGRNSGDRHAEPADCPNPVAQPAFADAARQRCRRGSNRVQRAAECKGMISCRCASSKSPTGRMTVGLSLPVSRSCTCGLSRTSSASRR